eukprot:NODE_3380_length_562_cov_108.783626_g2853_i0.p2 GENE.NODE_3380_length_562_cov_108.783626_g2853_i0~~NODE_3380_length_562_cov_108.783626_g2853_i0.p2  ORF type:complete len:55 (+),score=5.24 NODE_3380_length_562_cov_108.783626_g2853_i0:354-518(+)
MQPKVEQLYICVLEHKVLRGQTNQHDKGTIRTIHPFMGCVVTNCLYCTGLFVSS